MLDKVQLEELKEHLEKAQNPIFYFDNDADGLCSYILLRRAFGKGKGVAVRSYPDLNESYARKANELNADYVFILDKPVVSNEFFDKISEYHLPIVWVDHHEMDPEKYKKYDNLHIYNSVIGSKIKENEPVTFICYELTKRKEDKWIALVGCIADHYLPYFAEEFGEEYPELWGKEVKKPFDAYYRTEIGKIAMSFNFGLKDSTTHVVQMQNYLISCRAPGDVFAEVPGNYNLRTKFKDVRKKYVDLLERAKNCIDGKLLFFEYGGDLSISSDLSNELSYINPGIYIMVAYTNGGIINLSLRGKNVKKILEKVLNEIENASGGGHEDAVGARISASDITKFKELFKKEIEK
jgi:hypothetical protein